MSAFSRVSRYCFSLSSPAAHQHQVVVVGGEALERPQQARVVLLGEVVRNEGRRLDALDVPRMKVLVTGEPEEVPVALGGVLHSLERQLVTLAEQRRRIAVLEPAVAVADGHGHEGVAAERRLLRSRLEESDLRFAHAREVGGEALHVQLRHPARDGDLVRNAEDLEAAQFEGTHLDRAVDQFVVVGRLVRAEPEAARAARRAQPGRHLPLGVAGAGRRQDVHGAWFVLEADGQQEHGGAVEEAMRRVKMGGTHRQVPGVHLVGELDRPLRRRRSPRVLVELLELQLATAAQRGDADDVPGELPDHVAAGNPRGQHEELAGRIGPVDAAGDVEQVCGGIGRADRVVGRHDGS